LTPPVLLYSGPEDAAAVLQAAVKGRMTIRTVLPERAPFRAAIADAVAVLDASMKVPIDAEMIAAAPGLRVVATATTGADHIDAAALAGRGIPLLTLQGQTEILRGLTPAAEHSWLLLMACARQLRAATDHVLGGGWERTRFPGVMLRGRILGLVGCGRIGQWMALYARAFGMKVLGSDPYLSAWPATIENVPLAHLLASADFISVHVPLTPETRRMLGRDELARAKPGAILVNTSRGGVLDEAALLDALESGRLAAAGLDVLDGEPDVGDHPLRRYAETHANLVITPHIAGFSPDAVREVVAFTATRILRELDLA